MRVGRGLRETDLANWLPGEGTRRLFEVLQYSAKSGPDLPPSLSDTALRALLESADEKSSSKQLDVSGGIVAGVLLGLFFGTVAAYVGYQLDVRLFDLDAIGTAICLALASLCTGLILGPLVHAIMLRRKIPRRILERAVKDYGVEPRRIQELAAGHSRRTQAAARALDCCKSRTTQSPEAVTN